MEKKKVFIWVALIAIIAVIVFNLFSNGKQEDIIIDKEFSNVEIESDNAEVRLMSINDNDASIELENNEKNRYTLDVKVKGKTLEIDVNRKGFRWFSFDFFSKSPVVIVGLPKNEYGTIKIETDNGAIKVSEIELKELLADTDNGEIDIKEVESGKIAVETDNGDVLIENSSGVINGQTNNGDVTVMNDSIDAPMDLETDNGEILVKTKGESKNLQYNVKTDNGKVNIYGQSTTDKVIGDGKIIIQLESDNGNITIE
ncbi:DUF4097 family beta strand repeat-containing protein [Ureibacillus chungkukjangi]|uniref:Putative adhesin n=1 Tax=Ureibacillus chungkukjangi TaxID=1202712 RepID=A0A318TML6_9BACL|nr:DUF4097 family beta strand repeat-containing protein [Ureibacillus chungkukjangi]MCM3388568.1 DUF4097 domain-containing protein [Ureibacillus chungkukjangi]PYF05884.1 putative adhesin [Ureibacillus chungkukjangi]